MKNSSQKFNLIKFWYYNSASITSCFLKTCNDSLVSTNSIFPIADKNSITLFVSSCEYVSLIIFNKKLNSHSYYFLKNKSNFSRKSSLAIALMNWQRHSANIIWVLFLLLLLETNFHLYSLYLKVSCLIWVQFFIPPAKTNKSYSFSLQLFSITPSS